MNDDEIWASIDDQRRRTADLLDTLTDEQWRHASLCDGWTVRDVAAHLTMQQQTVGDAVRMVVRHPGSLGGLNRMIHETARHQAALATEEFSTRIRAMIGSRRHNVGVTQLETLIDILVHSQDIAVPLGLDLPIRPRAAATAATRVWSYGGKGKAKVFRTFPVAGLRFAATDTDWSVGTGSEVSGPITSILLVLTGRHVGLEQLSGTGADALRDHVLQS